IGRIRLSARLGRWYLDRRNQLRDHRWKRARRPRSKTSAILGAGVVPFGELARSPVRHLARRDAAYGSDRGPHVRSALLFPPHRLIPGSSPAQLLRYLVSEGDAGTAPPLPSSSPP